MISPGAFRLFLASIVVLAHFTKLGLGTAAVNLFFTLSGYWVYRMFDGKYERARHPGLLFILSRALRIFPVFLLFNGLAFLLHVALHDPTSTGQTWLDVIPNTLVIGYSSLPFRPLGPAWSLDMELQFYLMFPAIFALMGVLAKHMTWILIATLGLGGLYVTYFVDSDVGTATVFPCLGFFLLGMFAARNQWKPSAPWAYASALLSLGSILVLITVPSLRGIIIHNVNVNDFAWNSGTNFIIGLVAVPVALSSVFIRSTVRDRLVGDLSYVVYCSHWLAVIVAARFLSGTDKLEKGIAVSGLIALTYAASLLVLIYFDRPIGRWREAWVGRHLGAGSSNRAASSRSQPPAIASKG